MIEQLKQGRPLMIGYDHPDLDGDGRPDGGHAVVITAVKYRKDSDGLHIEQIVIRDPDKNLSETLGRRILRGGEYNRVSASFYVIPVE